MLLRIYVKNQFMLTLCPFLRYNRGSPWQCQAVAPFLPHKEQDELLVSFVSNYVENLAVKVGIWPVSFHACGSLSPVE